MKIYSKSNIPNFKASINKNTSSMKTACAYMEKHKNQEFPYKDTKTELELFNSIEKALAKHPSKEVLNITRIIDNRFFWNERALIKSTKASFVDVEPVRDDSIAGELGVIRRILDPENKKMFNELMGLEFSRNYDKWWNKHISPIWNSINNLYRENPAIEPNISDSEYNECFRKQIDIYDSQFLSKTNEKNKIGNNKDANNSKGKAFDASGLHTLILGFAIVMGVMYVLRNNTKPQNIKTPNITTTTIKDSVNKLNNDTLDLTKNFLK